MKSIKFLVCFVVLGFLSFQAFGWPPPRGCWRRSCPPPPPHHHCCSGNNGVRLAADIVNLVGASMNILNSPVAAVPVAAPVAVPYSTRIAVPPCYYYNNGYVPMMPVYR